MREGTKTLQAALEAEKPVSPQQQSSGRSDGFAMVERYFAQQAASRVRSRRNARQAPPPAPPEKTLSGVQTETEKASPRTPLSPEDKGTQDQNSSEQAVAPRSTPAPLEMTRLDIDGIDWEPKESQDWDALIADTGPSFLGLSFEEAKKRGLLDDLDADQ
jgi:hypothetical protein